MVEYIYPSEFQLNKANISETEASFFIHIYRYQMVFLRLKFVINEMNDFDIVNFPFLNGDARQPMVFIFLE